MTTIYKYTLKLQDSQILKLPKGAKILSVGQQHNQLQLWAEVDITQPQHAHIIHIYGTGNPIQSKYNKTFLGTVQTPPFVWHIFEITS